MARARLGPAVPGQVPVHDVPAAGAEPQLDRGGVEHHPVAHGHGPGELGQDVGPTGLGRPPAAARAAPASTAVTAAVRKLGTGAS